MVRVCGWLTVVVLAAGVGVTPRAAAQPGPVPTTLKLGVLSGMFRDVPPALVIAAATPFRDLFKKQTGINGDVTVVGDCETLAQKLDDKQLHFGVFHGFEWAWVKDRYPNLQPLAVTIPPQQPQACLVVNAGCDADSPAGLKCECVVPVGTKAHCDLFIDRLRENLPDGCCCPKKDATLGWEQALDDVAAGKATAALVDASALSAYQNNKPGSAAQLRVLRKSEPFPPTIVVYRKGAVADKTVRQIRNGLVGANKTAQGKAFLFLWKLKGFEDVPAGYDETLEKIREAYPPPTRPTSAPAPK